MKKIVLEFFALFGIGLYKIKKEVVKKTKPEYKPIKNFEVTSAFEHNTAERMNDFFSGTGHLLMYLSDHYKMKKVYGMDFSEAALAVAKQNLPDGEFMVHDIYKDHDKKYDVVMCTEVLEHLVDPEDALSNLEKMMNENSLLFITTPNGRTDTYKGHINYWGPEGWEIFLRKNCSLKNVRTGLIVDSRFNYACIKNAE